MKRIITAAIVVAVGAAALTGCGTGGGDGGEGTIGISMPTRDNERWINEADIMSEIFADAGYSTEVQFANNDTPTQVNQIENLIVKGVDALIISSVDGSALTTVLEEAEAQDIPVFAYTRLITDTTAVSYYATFDYYNNGVGNATAVLEGLGILDDSGAETGEEGPFNIELVGGSPTDNVSQYMYEGAMDTFGPFLDSGVLTIGSGQTTFEQTSTPNWDGEQAQSRMEDILATHYTSEQVDGVWVPYDGLTRGLISAFQGAGYVVGSDWPIMGGGNAELDSVKAILAGEQYSTSFDDYRELANAMGNLVVDVLDDGEVTESELDTETYDNGAKTVPTLLFGLRNVKADDVQSVLVDSGFYTAEQVGL